MGDGGLCGIEVGEHVAYLRDLGRGREGVLRRLVIGVLMRVLAEGLMSSSGGHE